MDRATAKSRYLAHPARMVTALAVLAAVMLSGCATPPGVVFEAAADAPAWPTPPDQPRIRYVGQLRTDDDLKAGRSGLQRLGDAIFGRKAVQGMVSPMAVCTDGAERVFIADSGAQMVHVLDLGSRRHERWAPTEPAARFIQPVGIACDDSGRVLVSDSQASQVVALTSEGKVAGILGRGSLRRPCGLSVDPRTQRIFVADAGAHQVVVLNPDGTESARIGERGGGPGQFNYPTNVAFDGAGRLYVSDSLNFRVQVFDTDLRPLSQIGRKGDMPGYFAQPKGLALDSADHLYVVDANFEAVQLFDQRGSLLMNFGREGSGPGEFWLPAGMYIDPKNRIWIADSYNRRVQVFDYLPEVTRP